MYELSIALWLTILGVAAILAATPRGPKGPPAVPCGFFPTNRRYRPAVSMYKGDGR